MSSAPDVSVRVFTAAPHRMMFFAGMLTAVATGVWWLAEMLGRVYPGLGLPPVQVAPMWVHAFLMLYCLVGSFIFGFLFTTFPRWQAGPEVPRSVYATVFAFVVAGLVASFGGLYLDARLFVFGAGFVAVGWWLGWLGLLWVMVNANGIVAHAVVAAIALGIGGAALTVFVFAFYAGDATLLHMVLRAAMWGYLLPLVYGVCHRMLPFFSQSVIPGYRVYRPAWRLVSVTVLCYLHVALALAGAYGWLWVADAPLALITLTGGLRWEPLRSRGTPLLWTLYAAYLWLPLGLLLQTIADVSYALTGEWLLGRAPLHALGIGFLASLVVAMATRVTLGHSGRKLWMDRYTVVCFLLVQAAAVLRVLSEISASVLPQLFLGLVAASAAAWLAGLAPWAVRYGRIYLVPRTDGRPG